MKWTAPTGEWTGYKVTIDGGNEQTLGKTETSVTFSGLTAGTQYSVKVVTVSAGSDTTEVTQQFYTSKLLTCEHGTLLYL